MIDNSNSLSNQVYAYASSGVNAVSQSVQEQGGVSGAVWNAALKIAGIAGKSFANAVTGGGYSLGESIHSGYETYQTYGKEHAALTSRQAQVRAIKNHQQKIASADRGYVVSYGGKGTVVTPAMRANAQETVARLEGTLERYDSKKGQLAGDAALDIIKTLGEALAPEEAQDAIKFTVSVLKHINAGDDIGLISTVAQEIVTDLGKELYADEDEAKRFAAIGTVGIKTLEALAANFKDNDGKIDTQGLKASLITISQEYLDDEIGVSVSDPQKEIDDRLEKTFDAVAENFMNNMNKV